MSQHKVLKATKLATKNGLLQLGATQSGNTSDGGFVLEYNGNTTKTYAGLIRHAANSKFYLFDQLTADPFASGGDTVNTAGAGFSKADLEINSLFASSGITISSGGAAITGPITSTTSISATSGTITGGNLTLGTNQLTSTNTNGNISLIPNGTGQVILGAIGNSIVLPADPTGPLHAATKQYVDNYAQGISYKMPARVATVVDLATLAGGILVAGSGATHTISKGANGTIAADSAAFDDITLVLGDRVLVKNQGDNGGNARDNGIYEVTNAGSAGTPWVLTRAFDANLSTEVKTGMALIVEEGTVYYSSGFVLQTINPIVLDTTALTFVQISQPGTATGNNVSTSGVNVFRDQTGNLLNFRDILTTSTSGSNTAGKIIQGTQTSSSITLNLDQSKITGTGILTSGSITSGFGSINIPSSTIAGSTITGTTLSTLSGGITASTSTLSFTGSSATNIISITDNLADSLNIKDGSSSFLNFVTTTGNYSVNMGQTLKLNNGALTFAGGNGNNNINVPDAASNALSIINPTSGQTMVQVVTSTGSNNQKILFPQGVLGFSSTTAASQLQITDNLADALNIRTSGASYLQFATTTGSQKTIFGTKVQLNNGTLSFNGASGNNVLDVPDNTSDALSIKIGSTNLFQVDTTTGANQISINPAVSISNNLTVTGDCYINGGARNKVSSISSSATIDNTYNSITVNATAGNVTITLPGSLANNGREYKFVKTDSTANTVTIKPSTGENFDGIINDTLILTEQHDHCMVQSFGSTGWYLF